MPPVIIIIFIITIINYYVRKSRQMCDTQMNIKMKIKLIRKYINRREYIKTQLIAVGKKHPINKCLLMQ